MSPRYRVSQCSIHLAAGIVLLLSGCASMTSSNEELQSVGEKEGIVIGSVLLTAAKGDANESGFAFLRGSKAGELEYSVVVSETGLTPFKTTYTLSATPGKEEFFVKKLPAGSYSMDHLKPAGLLAPINLRFSLGLKFEVKPRQVSYIGKLVLNFPDRITAGSRFTFAVQDARQETIEKLKNEYPSIAPNAIRELAGNIVPGNTVASPVLQRDTLTIINAMDGAEDKNCAKRTVVNTEIIKAPAPDSLVGLERWTLDRCGKKISYQVTFRKSAQGGTDVLVAKEK